MKLNEIVPVKDSRESFNESWLSESPMKTQPVEYYDDLVFQIKDFKPYFGVISLIDNWYKIQGKQTAIYWYEENDIIILGAEFKITEQAYIVSFLAKKPDFKSKPPYASDLYNIVLNDIKNSEFSIRIDSDKKLSDEGFSLWQRLFGQGHAISVYDTSMPGQTFTKINSIEELKQYFDKDPSFEKYRYALSENTIPSVILRCNFRSRKMREENNLL